MNSLPLIVKNGTLLYPAHAFASMVLPVPGGPVRRAPLGILAPSLWYFAGVCKKSMNYTTYYLAFCIPTTSLNVISTCWRYLLLFLAWEKREEPLFLKVFCFVSDEKIK
jgi:hypothetical protein